MKAVVASFKRLYEASKVTKDDMKKRVARGITTEDEYKIITGEDYAA